MAWRSSREQESESASQRNHVLKVSRPDRVRIRQCTVLAGVPVAAVGLLVAVEAGPLTHLGDNAIPYRGLRAQSTESKRA